ncbi:hypothetical protein ZIOFF_045545 [Zingiber officinale]|uniref:Uncharacterized protein n=1 Tax=Zingiber officinale TaxID=94328 RepID=A0A8J5G169_ZINOF|nr:hypothetical protein ZIOFF_045545 [Zingiber officinale]
MRDAADAEALKPVLPWAAEKSFDGVGEDYKRATVYNNKPAIFYTEEEVSGMSNAFRFALIGKFLESRSNQMTIIQSFANLWLSSFYNIRFMRFGHVFIHLSSIEDMARIWTRGFGV